MKSRFRSRRDPDDEIDRDTMIEEIEDFMGDYEVSPLQTTPLGYLAGIARDAGVSIADWHDALSRRLQLERAHRGGSEAAERAARDLGRMARELVDQVKNATTPQVRAYSASRTRWINS